MKHKASYKVNKVPVPAILPEDKVDQTATQIQLEDVAGTTVTVQESTRTTQPGIWLGTPWGQGIDTPIPRIHLNQKLAAELIPILQGFVETGRLEAASSWRLLGTAELAKAMRAELSEAHLTAAQEEAADVELAQRMRPVQAEATGLANRKIERSAINWTPEQFAAAGIEPEGAERAINLLIQLMAVLKANSFLVQIDPGEATIIHSPTETAVGWVESELIQ